MNTDKFMQDLSAKFDDSQKVLLRQVEALESIARFLRQASPPATWPEVDRRLFNRRVIDRRYRDAWIAYVEEHQ